ncbi:MAG: hypothetical protein AAFZ99_01245 [Pseudomonadota bacterium]
MKTLRELFDGIFRWWGRPNPHPNIGMMGDGDDVEYLEDIERTFDISIAAQEAEQIQTIGDLHRLILSKTPRWSGDEVWASITRMASEHTSFPPENMKAEMHFLDRIYD